MELLKKERSLKYPQKKKNEMSREKKNGGRRASIGFVVGTLYHYLSAFFRGPCNTGGMYFF